MFLKKSVSNGKPYLSFIQGYRKDGMVKQKTIEKIGYLEDLKKQFDDPIAHFKEIAKQRTNNEIKELIIKNINSKVIDNSSFQKNLGYLILKKIYKEIGLIDFFKLKQPRFDVEYDFNSIFELLIYSRILYPSSKKETFDNKEVFFDNFDFSLKNLYRSLDYFASFKKNIEATIWKHTKDTYNRDTSTVYYDCTNYYFEISYNDEDLVDEHGNILEKGYRKKGPSKENRPNPIIQMGLLMDKNGIPLSCDLFPGSDSEKTSLLPIVKRTKSSFDLGRIITVADRGLNTSDNTVFIAGKSDDKRKRDGYVFGQSVRGADQEFKDFVLNQNGYIIDIVEDKDGNKINFKHKSRIYAKKVTLKKDNVRKIKTVVYQKQMVYYSEKYAQKQKKERDLVILKAKDLINNPGRYTKATSVGAAGYINNIDYDKKSGQVIAKDLSLKISKIQEEEQFDGYYSIVTSEKSLSDLEIRNIYKGLWEIEETFKITKSNLETRPVFVWTKEHIEAHFLTCFVSLVILRLLEKKLNNNFSTEKIINSLRNYISINIEHDIYIQPYTNDIIKILEEAFNINLSKKYLTLSEIKKNF